MPSVERDAHRGGRRRTARPSTATSRPAPSSDRLRRRGQARAQRLGGAGAEDQHRARRAAAPAARAGCRRRARRASAPRRSRRAATGSACRAAAPATSDRRARPRVERRTAAPSSGASSDERQARGQPVRERPCRPPSAGSGCGDSAHLLERAVGVVAGEQARQRQERREQRGHPDHAGPDAREQLAVGRRREREERYDDHVEQELHRELRAAMRNATRRSRDERPANAGERAVGRGVAASPVRERRRISASASVRTRAGRRARSGWCVAATTSAAARARCARRGRASSASAVGVERRHRLVEEPQRARREARAARARRAGAGPATARAPGRSRCATPGPTSASASRPASSDGTLAGERRRARAGSPRRELVLERGHVPANSDAPRAARRRARPRRRRRRGFRPPRGTVSPASMRSSVVLPLPLRPVTISARPASTRRAERPRRAARYRAAP